MLTSTGRYISGNLTETGRLVFDSLSESGELVFEATPSSDITGTFSSNLNTYTHLTDMYYPTSFELTQETESLFLDRYFDAVYLESNNTLTAISGVFIPAILSQLISSTETESYFNAVFGNIGSIYFTQKTSSVFNGNVAVFGGFNLALSTTTSFDSSKILASFSLAGETLSSFSAFVGITGSFVFDQNTIVLFNGGASNTSTDIGNILSYKIVSVMNINTTGVSEYTNYNFNSFFSVGNKYYGCCSDGVFLLEGDLDNASSIAQSVIKTATTDFGTQKLKSVRDAYAYVRSSGDMFVSLVTNEQVDRSDYPLYCDGVDGVHRRRVKTAQGIRGTTWGASIKNDTNVDFTVKQLDVIPKELERSI